MVVFRTVLYSKVKGGRLGKAANEKVPYVYFDFVVVLGLFCRCFVVVLGLVCRCFVVVLGMFWGCFVVVVSLFWGCFGVVLGLFCRCFVAIPIVLFVRASIVQVPSAARGARIGRPDARSDDNDDIGKARKPTKTPVGSRNPAIHNAYRTSLRPSSLFEPRHPALKVVSSNGSRREENQGKPTNHQRTTNGTHA